MFALITKFVPLRYFIYLGVLLAVIAGGFYVHYRIVETTRRADQVAAQIASANVRAAADAQIVNDNVRYTTQLSQMEKANAKRKHDAAVQLAHDTQRLREYDAYRRAHEALDSAGAARSPGTPGNSGQSQFERSFEQLEQVASQLAAANRSAVSAIDACQAERNSLTGK